jgi:hypothetical protein
MGAALPFIAIGAQVMGSLSQAAGAKQSANAQAASANYQAQVATNNATNARQNEAWATQAGEQKVATQGLKNRATLGAILAGQGANGVDVNSGSALDVRQSAARLGQYDALTIKSNAAREAYGYQVQGSNFEAQSQLDRYEAESAKKAGDIGVMTSLLGGTASAVGKYIDYKKSGLFGGSATPTDAFALA